MITFKVESFKEIAAEAFPLLVEHAAEIDITQYGAEFQPDWELLYSLEDMGVTTWVCARNESGELVGYSIYFIAPSYWHRDYKIALNDAYYIRKEWRNGFTFKRMIAFSEKVMKEKGAGAISVEAWKTNRAARLLEHAGYEIKLDALIKVIGD